MGGDSGGNRFGRLLKSLNPYQCVRENLRDYGLPYRTILRNDARRHEAMLKPYKAPECKIPPLDALIIPKAGHECKTLSALLRISPVFFCLSKYIIIMHKMTICYNMHMKIMPISVLVHGLRQRLQPVEQAPTLIDYVEGQHADARKAAVLLAIFEQEGMPYIAFIRRASTLRSHSGEIAFPGGGVDAIDASLAMTALREAYEEIGLEPERVEILGVLPPVFTIVSNYLITPVVAYVPQGLGTTHLQASEVTELILVPLYELANPAIAHTEQWTRGDLTRTVYFYDYGPYRIWGATGRILSMLLALLIGTV